jgi:hypothetical protein
MKIINKQTVSLAMAAFIVFSLHDSFFRKRKRSKLHIHPSELRLPVSDAQGRNYICYFHQDSNSARDGKEEIKPFFASPRPAMPLIRSDRWQVIISVILSLSISTGRFLRVFWSGREIGE